MTIEEAESTWAPDISFGEKLVGFATMDVERKYDLKKGVGIRLVQLREPGNFEDVVRPLANLVFLSRESLFAFQQALDQAHKRFDRLEAEELARKVEGAIG